MIKNKGKVQYTMVIITDAICIIASFLGSYFVCDKILDVFSDYFESQMKLAYIPLLFTFIVVFWGFMPVSDITKRTWQAELKSVLKMNFMYAVILATTMFITRNPLTQSRYMYVFIIFFNVVFMFIGHRFLKRILIKNYKNGKMGNIVGIVSTNDRVGAFAETLKGDWVKKIVGIALIDQNSDEVYNKNYNEKKVINGIPVRAYRDNFMEWARREVLDEIFIDVSYDMRDVYLKSCIEELESMGIVVHLNLISLENFIDKDEVINYTLNMNSGYPMITFAVKQFDERHLFFKRFMDIVGSIVGCVISIPIIAIVLLSFIFYLCFFLFELYRAFCLFLYCVHF